ncbi:molybdenum cofactor guanylyltransferase [Bacillus sp. N9]
MRTIILAGGKSSRMGENKALMKMNGARVIDRLIAEFSPVSEEVILVTNDPLLYEELPVTLLEDCLSYKGQGPLAGIYTGLSAVNNDPCLIVACDLPFATSQFGQMLVNRLLEKTAMQSFQWIRSKCIHCLLLMIHELLARWNRH